MKEKMKQKWMPILIVVAAAVIVYANSLGNGFVTDDATVMHNPALQGSPFALFSTIDSISDSQILPFYRPLTYLTFAVEGRLHDFDPFWMHLVNILLHAINAMLVYLLAKSLLGDYRPALLAGLLFAVHPINSESVNFLSGGRNTLLACLFVLMAYLSHRRSLDRSSNAYALVGALFFFAGLLSKEFALMVLPFIVAQEIMLMQKRGTVSRSASVMRLIPYVIAMTGYLLLRWLTLSRLGLQASIIPGIGAQTLREMYDIPSFTERIFNNIYIIPRYLWSVVWPTSLSPRYMAPGVFQAIASQLTVAWVCIIFVLIWLLKKGGGRATLFGLSWLFVFWIPVSGIFYFSIIEMADRYFYIPAIGLWMIVADQSSRWMPDGKRVIRCAAIMTTIVCIAMAALTMKRNLDWKSDFTLFSRMVEQYPENPNGYYHLGRAYLARQGPNDLSAAQQNFERVLVLDPSTPSIQALLGYIRLQQGDLQGALLYLSEALRRSPLDREARINRAITYEEMGRLKEALADYEYYLKIPGRNDLPGSQEYAQAKVIELRR